MFLWHQIQLSLEFSKVTEEWGIKFCPTASFASASQLKKLNKQKCAKLFVLFVRVQWNPAQRTPR